MILASEGRAAHEWGELVVCGTVVAVLALAWISLALAGLLSRVLGKTGINVITRILGVLLAALAVQYVAEGAIGFLI
jgi:multiple antibiotic resistance protein